MRLKLFFTALLLCAAVWSQIIESLTENGFSTPLRPSVDSVEKFEFRVDCPVCDVRLRIRPQQFQIKSGSEYWIEPSVSRPFTVYSKTDAELELALPGVPYQWVRITLASPLLLKQTSAIETVDSATACLQPLDGGGMLLSKGKEKEPARFIIDSGIVLVPDQRYRLLFGGKLHRTDYGVSVCAGVDIKSESGTVKRYCDYAGFNEQRIGTEGFGDGYCLFTIPENWQSATAEVFVMAKGGLCQAEFTNLDLRLAPEILTNWPRHHGCATQYKPVISHSKLKELLKKREAYSAQLVRWQERTMLEVNGNRIPITGYRDTFGPTAGMLAKTGYPISWMNIRNFSKRYKKNSKALNYIWLDKDKYDFEELDRQLQDRMSYAPDQPILLLCGVAPYQGFGTEHPDALYKNEDGEFLVASQSPLQYYHSICGKSYRMEVGTMLKALGQHLSRSVWGKNVIGIHICDGGDGQWYPWLHGDWKHFHFDHSKESRQEYRNMMKYYYDGNIGKLREAWGMPNAEFDTLQLPKSEEWLPFFATLMKPDKPEQRRLIDFACATDDILVDTIDYLIGCFKEGMGRPAIGSVYFPHPKSNTAAMRAKNIDGIVSVPFYGGHRKIGSVNVIEQAAGSFRVNDKFCLIEMDHRTDFSELGCRAGGFDRRALGVPLGAEGFAAQMRRDFSANLTQGGYAWMFSIAGYSTWSENYYTVLPEFLLACNFADTYPMDDDWGQIAFITDYRADANSGRPYGFHYNIARVPRKNIARSGVTFNDYSVMDIGNKRIENGKIFFLANVANISSEQVEYIEKNWQKNGNVIVCSFGTGLNTHAGLDATIKRLTGISVKHDFSKTVFFEHSGRIGTDDLCAGLAELNEEPGDLVPLIWIEDADAVPLAWHKSMPELAAAAVKRYEDWTAVYLANGCFRPEFARALAKEAKIKLAGPLGDILFGGNSIRTINARTSGFKTLHWDFKANVIDLETGQIVGYAVESYSCVMKAGETRWFQLRK